MIDDLFDFYKNELTFYSQVTKENKNLKNTIFFSGFIFLFLGFLFFIYTKQYFWFVIGTIIFVINSLITVWLEGRTIKDKFPEMYISPFKWNSKKLNELFIDKLGKKIKNESKSNLDLIQKQIKENADNEKIPSIIIITTLGVLFVPLWSVYISEVMEIYKGNFKLLTITFLLFFIFILIISISARTVIGIRDNLSTDYMKWNRLNYLITQYRIKKKVG